MRPCKSRVVGNKLVPEVVESALILQLAAGKCQGPFHVVVLALDRIVTRPRTGCDFVFYTPGGSSIVGVLPLNHYLIVDLGPDWSIFFPRFDEFYKGFDRGSTRSRFFPHYHDGFFLDERRGRVGGGRAPRATTYSTKSLSIFRFKTKFLLATLQSCFGDKRFLSPAAPP